MINKEDDGSWCLLSAFACGEANADPAASIMCRSRPSSIEPWSG